MGGACRLSIAIPVLAFLVCGCAPTNPAAPQLPAAGYDARDFMEDPAASAYSHGPAESSRAASLWVDNLNDNYLLSNHKARRINDVITIRIVESTQGSKDSQTKTKRQSSVGAGIDGLLGLENTIPLMAPNINMGTMIGGTTKSAFDGSGKTTRNEKLVGTVTALVIDVLPNGNLVVEGRRRVQVNYETQIMIIRGIVRPRDVDADNTVLSTQIADAEIIYAGEGVISEKQKPGWLSRGVDKTWPF